MRVPCLIPGATVLLLKKAPVKRPLTDCLGRRKSYNNQQDEFLTCTIQIFSSNQVLVSKWHRCVRLEPAAVRRSDFFCIVLQNDYWLSVMIY